MAIGGLSVNLNHLKILKIKDFWDSPQAVCPALGTLDSPSQGVQFEVSPEFDFI